MKRILLIILLSVTTCGLLGAQNCSSSPFFQDGKQFVFLAQMPDFGKSHVPGAAAADKTIRETFAVKSVKHEGGNIISTLSIVKWEDSSDPNAKNPLGNILGAVICTGHSLKYIYNVNMGAATIGDTLEFPFNMKAGDNLQPRTQNVSINGQGGKTINLVINSTISVTGHETVTTPAGTWNCYKILLTSTSQMPAMGKNPSSPLTQTEDIWFAPGIGIIKTQFGARFSVTLQNI